MVNRFYSRSYKKNAGLPVIALMNGISKVDIIMTVTSFNSKIEDLFKSSWRTITTPYIRNWLTYARQTTAINNQQPLFQIQTVHLNTSLVYRNLSACSNKLNVVTKVQQKTESC